MFNQADFLANTVSTVYPNAPAGALYYGDKGVSRAVHQELLRAVLSQLGRIVRSHRRRQDRNSRRRRIDVRQSELLYQPAQPAEPAVRYRRHQRADLVVGAGSASPLRGRWARLPPAPSRSRPMPTPSQALFFAQSQYIVTVPQFKPAYTIQWTLSIQREFGHGWQAQVDYIGNATRHDPMGYHLRPGGLYPRRLGCGRHRLHGHRHHGSGRGQSGRSRNQLLHNREPDFALPAHARRIPTQGNQYPGRRRRIRASSATAARPITTAWSTSLNHRLSSTFSLLANWTWSKCLNIDDAQGDLPERRSGEPQQPGDGLRPMRLRLPAHRERLAGRQEQLQEPSESRWRKALVNGWELAPLMHIQTGAPFTVTSGQDNSLTDVGNDRPNLVAGVNPYAEVKFQKCYRRGQSRVPESGCFSAGLANSRVRFSHGQRLPSPGNLRKHQQERVLRAQVSAIRRPDFADLPDPREPGPQRFGWRHSTC